MAERKDSGHFGVAAAYGAAFPDLADVPACPTCKSTKFVASLIDMKDSVTKGVCCENGHGWMPADLVRVTIGEARRAERFAGAATQRALDMWLEEFGKEIKGATDRASAILSGAMLDEMLALLAKAKCIDDEEAEKRLFAPQRPLGTFGARIEFCYMLGLISEEEWKGLLVVAKIRNAFAHKLENLSFADEGLSALARNLADAVRARRTGSAEGRECFDAGVSALWGSLVEKYSLVVRSARMPMAPTMPIHMRRIAGRGKP